jgi:hypothetical protein
VAWAPDTARMSPRDDDDRERDDSHYFQRVVARGECGGCGKVVHADVDRTRSKYSEKSIQVGTAAAFSHASRAALHDQFDLCFEFCYMKAPPVKQGLTSELGLRCCRRGDNQTPAGRRCCCGLRDDSHSHCVPVAASVPVPLRILDAPFPANHKLACEMSCDLRGPSRITSQSPPAKESRQLFGFLRSPDFERSLSFPTSQRLSSTFSHPTANKLNDFEQLRQASTGTTLQRSTHSLVEANELLILPSPPRRVPHLRLFSTLKSSAFSGSTASRWFTGRWSRSSMIP